MTPIKVYMWPPLSLMKGGLTSGMAAVVNAYYQYLPAHGIQFVDANHADIIACHVEQGKAPRVDVLHNHGLIWAGDAQNARIAAAARQARVITVPSRWVGRAFERDMRTVPIVVPHGIDLREWAADADINRALAPYVLWNKNRIDAVCDPSPVLALAGRFPSLSFVTTFAPPRVERPPNVRVTGIQPHSSMQTLVKGAAVYLATTQETFGVGTVEAMAAGVPILGYAHGAITDMVEHGVTGYLARPGDLEDLAAGLSYCLAARTRLGVAAHEAARAYTWDRAARLVARIYDVALSRPAPTVAIIIPCYNKAATVARAMWSAARQTTRPVEIIVVDDGSTDTSAQAARACAANIARTGIGVDIDIITQPNGGVAAARNRGIAETGATYVCCLDADDELAPDFLSTCLPALENDRGLGGVYTSLLICHNGKEVVSQWPGECDPVKQGRGQNQVATCVLMRRQALESLGGYRNYYCPTGAGSEDAELWL